MDGVDAVCEKVDYLLGRKSNACLPQCLRIVLKSVDYAQELLRKSVARDSADPFDLRGVGDGHYSRNHGHVNPCAKKAIHKVVENVVVKKHLSGEKFTAVLDLYFKVFYVLGRALALGVGFGVARAANAEVAVALYFVYKLVGIVVVEKRAVKICGNIPAQGEYVFYTLALKKIKLTPYLILVG